MGEKKSCKKVTFIGFQKYHARYQCGILGDTLHLTPLCGHKCASPPCTINYNCRWFCYTNSQNCVGGRGIGGEESDLPGFLGVGDRSFRQKAGLRSRILPAGFESPCPPPADIVLANCVTSSQTNYRFLPQHHPAPVFDKTKIGNVYSYEPGNNYSVKLMVKNSPCPLLRPTLTIPNQIN